MFCLQETLNGNQNNWICDMSTRGFLIEIFMTYIQCTAERSNLWHFIHFYYSQIMGILSRNFYCFLIHIIFKVLFNDCGVTTLKIIHPITFRNYSKHPIKVFRSKNNIMYMQPFYKTVPRNPSEIVSPRWERTCISCAKFQM